jgi:protein TonB
VPAVAPKQAKIDAPPKPRKTIRPDYPKGARQRGEQGDVVLEIRVNAAGIVDRVDIVSPSGFSELDEAAVRAARAARFTPAKSGGSPVASTARLKLDFKLK